MKASNKFPHFAGIKIIPLHTETIFSFIWLNIHHVLKYVT